MSTIELTLTGNLQKSSLPSIRSGILSCLKNRGYSGHFEIGINFLNPEKALSLNRKYRNQDYIPEVLSFPIEQTVPSTPYTSTPILLGDIFFCLPAVRKRARSSGHTIDHELQFLASHATDHLLGFHHKERK